MDRGMTHVSDMPSSFRRLGGATCISFSHVARPNLTFLGPLRWCTTQPFSSRSACILVVQKGKQGIETTRGNDYLTGRTTFLFLFRCLFFLSDT